MATEILKLTAEIVISHASLSELSPFKERQGISEILGPKEHPNRILTNFIGC
jgi:hypothetical protein